MSPPTEEAGEPPVIDIQGLGLTFKSADTPVTALVDITLAIRAGELVSLIGPSGCGKTTLLRVMADLAQPTSGRIRVNGVSPEQARLARGYGYVFQAPALYPWRTVLANVLLPLEIMGLPRREREERAHRCLALVGLETFERKYPWQLSGGMQQRVSIARALGFEPRLLLMDEPFGALDEITRDRLNEQLIELQRRTGKTIVFVTHSVPEAVYLSDRIVVMSARPGSIQGIVDSDLPRDRGLDIRDAPRFQEIARAVRERLRTGHDNGS